MRLLIAEMITDEGEIQMGLEVFYDLFQLFLYELRIIFFPLDTSQQTNCHFLKVKLV